MPRIKPPRFFRPAIIPDSGIFKGGGKIANKFPSLRKTPKNIKPKKIPTSSPQPSSLLDNKAKKMGFENALDFNNFIKNVDPDNMSKIQIQKAKKLKNFLSGSKTKNAFVKMLLGASTLTAMVVYLKRYSDKHSGCFRYFQNNDSMKDKISGKTFYCGGSSNSTDGKNDDDDDDDGILPEKKHPLFNHPNKWDCNFKDFENVNEYSHQIINQGCNGLCNIENFNYLVKNHTNPSKNFLPIENPYPQFVYKCENISLLEALSKTAGDTVDEITSGLFDSELFGRIITLAWQIFFLLLMLIITYKSFKYFYYNDNNNNNNNKQKI